MRKNYKRKRERNKNKTIDQKPSTKSDIITVVIVFVAFIILYGLTIYMGKIGVFDKGYTPKTIGTATISYENIAIGTTFNRVENEYYVLFKDGKDKFSYVYLDTLVTASDNVIYIVDMSIGDHKKYMKETSNKNVSKVTELAISDVTLLRIRNKKNVQYIEGLEKIVDFLEK